MVSCTTQQGLVSPQNRVGTLKQNVSPILLHRYIGVNENPDSTFDFFKFTVLDSNLSNRNSLTNSRDTLCQSMQEVAIYYYLTSAET